MVVIHIVAMGPIASGKSLLIRHFAKNPPKGYKLKGKSVTIPFEPSQDFPYQRGEYRCLTFEKVAPEESEL